MVPGLIEPHALEYLEAMRGKGVEIWGFALKAQYVYQIKAFGAALDHPYGVCLAFHRPVANVVGRPVFGIDTNGVIYKRGRYSGLGKRVVSNFHKLKV